MTVARFGSSQWRRALKPFAQVQLEVNAHFNFHTSLRRPTLGTLLALLVGGNVRGLCRKTDGEPLTGCPETRIICLDCDSVQLLHEDSALRCQSCGRIYPIIDGVLRMLPAEMETRQSPS